VVGTGRIGLCFVRIMAAFGCRVLACDPAPSDEVVALGARYVEWPELLAESDIVSLHCPLTPATRHLVDAAALARMKRGAMLVNTSRGAVIDTTAVIGALKRGQLGGLGLDVYEEEDRLFFRDLSDAVLQDDVFARLLTFPNVVITGHQGFFTAQAMAAIARTTLANADAWAETGQPLHPVTAG
jgi:D-lactate dehydrogenase